MIDPNIQTLAREHAEQLQALGVSVIPRPGTPLAELVAYCRPNLDGESIVTTDDFDATMEGLADFIADKTRQYSDFARNVSKPALSALAEAVRKAIQESDVNPFADLKINEVGAPAVLEDPEFLRSVSHFNSGSANVPPVNPRYGQRTDAQIIDMALTGSDHWDSSIKAWLAKLPEGHLQTVWQTVFMDKVNNPVTAPISSLENLLKDYSKGNFSALVLFLIASRIHKNIDDEFGTDLDTARQFLYALLQACSMNIENGINWFNTFVSTASLVSEVNREKRTITVNSAVYKQFVAEGGKADVLMGMLVTGKSYSTVAEINSHADELLADWGSYTQARQSDSEAAYEKNVRSIMLRLFIDSLNTPVGEVEQAELAKPGVKDTAINIFQQELQGYTRGQLHTNWMDVLWRCACKGRYYYHSFVYPLLDAMDYQINQRGLDPQDAHTIAVTQLVASYVAEMLKKD